MNSLSWRRIRGGDAAIPLGGIGSVWGPIIGASVLFPLSEITRVWLGGSGGAEDLMIYGALILVLSVVYPGGLVGLFRRFLAARHHA